MNQIEATEAHFLRMAAISEELILDPVPLVTGEELEARRKDARACSCLISPDEMDRLIAAGKAIYGSSFGGALVLKVQAGNGEERSYMQCKDCGWVSNTRAGNAVPHLSLGIDGSSPVVTIHCSVCYGEIGSFLLACREGVAISK
ncbi:MAG TPA: hypothetical protein VMW41_03095 [Candidatus Bathyarchaeia archaeon]|nr:hypothetical protein [Candidatus Bathyarchaeia archaeon]